MGAQIPKLGAHLYAPRGRARAVAVLGQTGRGQAIEARFRAIPQRETQDLPNLAKKLERLYGDWLEAARHIRFMDVPPAQHGCAPTHTAEKHYRPVHHGPPGGRRLHLYGLSELPPSERSKLARPADGPKFRRGLEAPRPHKTHQTHQAWGRPQPLTSRRPKISAQPCGSATP